MAASSKIMKGFYYGRCKIFNFISVVKQNLLFQAQIRGLEEHLKIIPELQKSAEQFEELKVEIVELKEDNINLKNQLESKNAIVENADKIDTDRFRLQTAVNTQMREISGYKETIENLQNTLKETTEKFQNQLILNPEIFINKHDLTIFATTAVFHKHEAKTP